MILTGVASSAFMTCTSIESQATRVAIESRRIAALSTSVRFDKAHINVKTFAQVNK